MLSSSFFLIDGTTDPVLDCCADNSKKITQISDTQNDILVKLRISQDSMSFEKDTTIINIHHQKKPEIYRNDCDIFRIIGAIIGAAISGGIALFVFLLGESRKKKSEKQKRKSFGKELITIIISITKIVNDQLEQFKRFIETTREAPYKTNILFKLSFHQLKRIKSFDTTLIFKTFDTIGLKEKDYLKFYSNIDFLDDVINAIFSDYDENNSKHITPMSNEFIKTRNELLDICTDYLEVQRRLNNTEDELYLFINQQILDYYQHPDMTQVPNIHFDIQYLIRPIKTILLERFRDWDITNSILKKAKFCGDLYTSIVQINTSFVNDIEKQIVNINKINISLNNIFENI